MPEDERIEVVNPDGSPTGVIRSRREIHRDGNWHRTVHVWVRNSAGELLLQKRSASKETHPGMWDISAAGHVAAGELSENAALRELREELGLERSPNQIRFLFTTPTRYQNPATGLTDNEITDVYLTEFDSTVENIECGRTEVDEVLFIAPVTFARRIQMRDSELVAHNEEFCRLFSLLVSLPPETNSGPTVSVKKPVRPDATLTI